MTHLTLEDLELLDRCADIGDACGGAPAAVPTDQLRALLAEVLQIRATTWTLVSTDDKPAVGSLVLIDVPDMGVAVGRVKPHWRTADDLRIESDEGYTYELSRCSRFCVLSE